MKPSRSSVLIDGRRKSKTRRHAALLHTPHNTPFTKPPVHRSTRKMSEQKTQRFHAHVDARQGTIRCSHESVDLSKERSTLLLFSPLPSLSLLPPFPGTWFLLCFSSIPYRVIKKKVSTF